MTLLELLQTAAVELKQSSTFTSVLNSSNTHVRLLLALANAEIQECRRLHPWPALVREAQITLVAAQDSYALPDDFGAITTSTGWDRTSADPLIGPLSGQEWAEAKSGLVDVSIYKQWRIKGIANKRLYIHTTPSTSDAGKLLVLEYASLNGAKPMTWAANTSFAPASYCFYDGNYYRSAGGGTSGSTAPTHTTGSASDGSISWAYSTALYDRFLADTDVPLFDTRLFLEGLKWRWLKANGLSFENDRALYYDLARRAFVEQNGTRPLSLTGKGGYRLLDGDNMPQTITGY